MTERLFAPMLLVSVALIGCASRTPATNHADVARAPSPSGFAPHDFGAQRFDVHDFDFLKGEWDMINRRLAHRGVGSQEWVEFPSVARNEQFLGGLADVDEVNYPDGITGKNDGPYSGLAVRTFDVEKQRWSNLLGLWKARVLPDGPRGGRLRRRPWRILRHRRR